MYMKSTTRDKIIEAATELITKYGFNYTGISQILKQIQVPKGSFYHYFDSKEALGYAVIEQASETHFNNLDCFFNQTQGTPLEKIKNFFNTVIEHYDLEACHSCIIGNLGQELAEQHEGYRQKLAQIFINTEQYFVKLFEEAKTVGELAENFDSNKLAEFFFTAWEGAILSAKVKNSKQPMTNFIELFFDPSGNEIIFFDLFLRRPV